MQCINNAHAMQGGEDMIDVPGPIARSEYRKEIDDMLANGDTYVAISNWLRNNGEVISRNLLAKYHKFCFNINDKAAMIYNQAASEARLEEEAVKAAITLQLCDKYLEMGMEVNPYNLDDKSKAEIALKAAKQREDFLKEHGDRDAEIQTQLLKEIRDELIKGSLEDLIRGMSDERTKKRISQATDPT